MRTNSSNQKEHQGSKVIVAVAFVKEALTWLGLVYTVIKIVALLQGVHIP